MSSTSLSIGQMATLACLVEVISPKPGNVHRGADFDDLAFGDFALCAVILSPIIDAAPAHGVGHTVFQAVAECRRWVETNVNLGTILLLAPMAAVPRPTPLAEGLPAVLGGLTPRDSRLVYDAIRLAQPGGLGEAPQMDVKGAAPGDLVAAMRAAADRDLVARQYAFGFREILDRAVPGLVAAGRRGWALTDAVIRVHLELMHAFPDSLIARKCGAGVAAESAARAGAVLEAGEPGDGVYHEALADFDFWLRSDGHRRNPGTTADLVAAALFAALREGFVEPPLRWRTS